MSIIITIVFDVYIIIITTTTTITISISIILQLLIIFLFLFCHQVSAQTQLVRSHGRTIHKKSTVEILLRGKMLGDPARLFPQPHRFEKHTYTTPTYCDQCSQVLWGLSKTGGTSYMISSLLVNGGYRHFHGSTLLFDIGVLLVTLVFFDIFCKLCVQHT